MEKVITVGGKEIRLRASALIPRLYRCRFGRDLIADMRELQKRFDRARTLPADATEQERKDAQLSTLDLTIFENVAYLMAKQADKNLPGSPEAWLDSLDGVFSIYEILPEILELWQLSNQTTAVPKKN